MQGFHFGPKQLAQQPLATQTQPLARLFFNSGLRPEQRRTPFRSVYFRTSGAPKEVCFSRLMYPARA